MKPEDIKALRMSLGATQERFAHLLGTTVVTINRWENGKTKPSRLYVRELKELRNGKSPTNAEMKILNSLEDYAAFMVGWIKTLDTILKLTERAEKIGIMPEDMIQKSSVIKQYILGLINLHMMQYHSAKELLPNDFDVEKAMISLRDKGFVSPVSTLKKKRVKK